MVSLSLVRFDYVRCLHFITQMLGFSTLDFFLNLGNKILKSYIIEPN